MVEIIDWQTTVQKPEYMNSHNMVRSHFVTVRSLCCQQRESVRWATVSNFITVYTRTGASLNSLLFYLTLIWGKTQKYIYIYVIPDKEMVVFRYTHHRFWRLLVHNWEISDKVITRLTLHNWDLSDNVITLWNGITITSLHSHHGIWNCN